MSTANPHDTYDPNSLLYYAPRRLRDRANGLRSIQQRPEDGGQSIPTAQIELPDTAALRQQAQNTAPPQSPFPKTLQALEPEAMESLSLLGRRARTNEILSVVTRFIAVAAIAAGISFLYVVYFSRSRDQAQSVKSGGSVIASVSPSETGPIDPPPQKTPPLKIAPTDAKLNESPPLEANVIVAHPVATISIPAPAENALVPPDPLALKTTRQMDPKEIAALTKRGEELLSNGDISAARLLLQRAAEAHYARAAFDLASSYDSTKLGNVSLSGGGPDMALARVWYQRARDWGSPEAPIQLEALSDANR